jgi:hypothetical protein
MCVSGQELNRESRAWLRHRQAGRSPRRGIATVAAQVQASNSSAMSASVGMVWPCGVGATFHMRSLVDVVILLRAWQVGPQSNYSLSSAYINREDDFVGRVEPVAVIIRPACKASGME